MGLYRRPNSPYWWTWLPTAPKGRQKVRTNVLIGDRSQEAASRKIAEKVYFARMGQLALETEGLPQPKEGSTLASFAGWYDTHVISTHRGAVREREILKVLVKAFGPRDLAAIDKDAVIEWHAARAAERSASTANRELDLLKTILAAAAPKYLKVSPIVGMKRLRGRKPKRRLLSPDEETRLLKAATDPQDHALLVLGIDTLMRLGDLLGLRRVDRKGVWLYVAYPKGGEPYEVPLSPRGAVALDAIKGDKDYFFSKFRQARHPRDWRSAVRQRLEHLCKDADVPFGRKEGGITFHWATRRTGASRLLVDRLQPVTVVQQLGNWKSSDVLLEIYSEAQRTDLLRAVGSLPQDAHSKPEGS